MNCTQRLPKYLRDADVTHVVLMGGTAALSDAVEKAIRDLGIVNIDRMAGATRFDTAAKFARYVADRFSADCFAREDVGLARSDVPFDSLGSAPLLSGGCPALVLTNSKSIPKATAQYLDDARRLGSPNSVTVSVFGGEAAVSQAALNAYLGIETPDDDATANDAVEHAPDLTTIEGVFAQATSHRKKIVKELTAKINAGTYGINRANVLRGPAGFSIDLDDCPSGWSDATGITDTQIRIGHTTAQSGNLAAYGNIAYGWENYFNWINENDPIMVGGSPRDLTLIIKDDAYVAARTIDHVNSHSSSPRSVFSILTLGSPNTLRGVRQDQRGVHPAPIRDVGPRGVG